MIRLWGKVDLVRFGGLFFLFGLTSLGWVVVALFAFGGYLAGFWSRLILCLFCFVVCLC